MIPTTTTTDSSRNGTLVIVIIIRIAFLVFSFCLIIITSVVAIKEEVFLFNLLYFSLLLFLFGIKVLSNNATRLLPEAIMIRILSSRTTLLYGMNQNRQTARRQ